MNLLVRNMETWLVSYINNTSFVLLVMIIFNISHNISIRDMRIGLISKVNKLKKKYQQWEK